MPHIACSTATLPYAINKDIRDPYIQLMLAKEIYDYGLIEGFELVLLPDWNEEWEPLLPVNKGEQYLVSLDMLADLWLESELPVLSIHANRDLGMLIATKEDLVQKAIADTIKLAKKLKAQQIVLHPWNTYSKTIPIEDIAEFLKGFDKMISLENIPTSSKHTPIEILRELGDRIDLPYTIDLSWLSMYDDWQKFNLAISSISNIHMQGALINKRLIPRQGNLNLETVLKELINRGYDGQITLELNRPKDLKDFYKALMLIKDIISS